MKIQDQQQSLQIWPNYDYYFSLDKTEYFIDIENTFWMEMFKAILLKFCRLFSFI